MDIHKFIKHNVYSAYIKVAGAKMSGMVFYHFYFILLVSVLILFQQMKEIYCFFVKLKYKKKLFVTHRIRPSSKANGLLQ